MNSLINRELLKMKGEKNNNECKNKPFWAMHKKNSRLFTDGSIACKLLASANHDLLSIDDIQTLGGVNYATPHKIKEES